MYTFYIHTGMSNGGVGGKEGKREKHLTYIVLCVSLILTVVLAPFPLAILLCYDPFLALSTS